MEKHNIILHHLLRRKTQQLESGQGLAEYALLLALTSVVLIVGLTAMGPAIGDSYNRIIHSFGINTTADEAEEETPPEEEGGGGGGEETPTPIPTATINVYVIDGSSVGITGVEVSVYQDGNPYKDISGTTDANGRVGFVLELGTYSFIASYDGNDYPSAGSYTLPDVSTATIQIIQPESIEFTVKVVDSLSLPVSGVTVTLHNTSGAYLNVTAVTDGSGNATLAVPSGMVKFKAVVGGNNYWSAEIDTQSSTTTTITVPIGDYTITVRRWGSPLAGATVSVLNSDGSSTGISAKTDTDGKIVVTLSPGSYKFSIKKRNKTWGTGAFTFPDSNPLTINL